MVLFLVFGFANTIGRNAENLNPLAVARRGVFIHGAEGRGLRLRMGEYDADEETSVNARDAATLTNVEAGLAVGAINGSRLACRQSVQLHLSRVRAVTRLVGRSGAKRGQRLVCPSSLSVRLSAD